MINSSLISNLLSIRRFLNTSEYSALLSCIYNNHDDLEIYKLVISDHIKYENIFGYILDNGYIEKLLIVWLNYDIIVEDLDDLVSKLSEYEYNSNNVHLLLDAFNKQYFRILIRNMIYNNNIESLKHIIKAVCEDYTLAISIEYANIILEEVNDFEGDKDILLISLINYLMILTERIRNE